MVPQLFVVRPFLFLNRNSTSNWIKGKEKIGKDGDEEKLKVCGKQLGKPKGQKDAVTHLALHAIAITPPQTIQLFLAASLGGDYYLLC